MLPVKWTEKFPLTNFLASRDLNSNSQKN